MMRQEDFTLFELLVVIAIFVLLFSIITPLLKRIKNVAAKKSCGSNSLQIMMASMMQTNENDENVHLSAPRYNIENSSLVGYQSVDIGWFKIF